MENLAQFLNSLLSNPGTRRALIDLSLGSFQRLSNMYNEHLDNVAWNIAYARFQIENEQEEN